MQKEIPETEGKLFITYILAADFINSIAREIIIVKGTGREEAAKWSIAIFTILLLFLSIWPLVECIRILVCKCQPHKWNIPSLVQYIGALLYFYGDNINEILEMYGDKLRCCKQCVENNSNAAIMALGLAFIILQFGPEILHVCIPPKKHRKSIWYSALDMVVTITKIDLVYTTITSVTNVKCTFSIYFNVISITAGIAHMISKCTHLTHNINDLPFGRNKLQKGVLWFFCSLLMISFCLYIVADNPQPLQCISCCDNGTSNITMMNDCNETMNETMNQITKKCTTVKLSLITVSFIAFLIVEIPLVILFLSPDPLPLKKLWETVWLDLIENDLETELAAKLLALLPVQHVAEPLRMKLVSAKRMAEILAANTENQPVMQANRAEANAEQEIQPVMQANRAEANAEQEIQPVMQANRAEANAEQEIQPVMQANRAEANAEQEIQPVMQANRAEANAEQEIQPVIQANRAAEILAVVPAKQVAEIIAEQILPANRAATILVQDVIPPNLVAKILAEKTVTTDRAVHLIVNLNDLPGEKWIEIANLRTQPLKRLHAKLQAADRANMPPWLQDWISQQLH